MAVNRRILGATALVAAGVVAATAVGQLPAFGVADRAQVITPSSAPQSLVCPGPAIAVGGDPANADALTATGVPARTGGTVGAAKLTSTPLGRGGVRGGAAPRSLGAPAARSAGAIAAVQVQQVAVGDAVGLVATPCTAPRSDLWFTAGATTTGRTTVLTLANPLALAAEVRLRVWSENGPVDAGAFRNLVVPAKGRTAVSLAGIAPSAGGVVVRVTSTGGRVAGALEQRTVRGLESGGVDMSGPTTAPALQQVVPGVRIAGAAAVAAVQRADDSADLQTVVRVLVPGSAGTDVAITATPDGGGRAVTLGRGVAGGVVTDFPVTGLADGTYTIRVSAKRPVVAGVRTSVVGDAGASTVPASAVPGPGAAAPTDGVPLGAGAAPAGDGAPVGSATADAGTVSGGSATASARGIDLAWLAAAPRLSATSAVAVGDAPSPILTIVGTGAKRTVQLSGAVRRLVQVPADGSVAVPVSRGLVVLRGASGLRAAVSYAGPDAIGGYPVAAADQEARPVRITR